MAEERHCYVYGVVGAGDDLPAVTGLDDEEIFLVPHAEVAAVVSWLPADRSPARRADLLAHGRVLDTVAAERPVIPVRFGSIMFSVDDVVQELLAPNAERFADVLAGLAGRAQFTLQARYDEDAVLAEVVSQDHEIADLRRRTREAPGIETYGERVRLGELVARAVDAKREFDTATLMDALVPHCVAYNERQGSGLDHLADVAFLVDDDQREEFESVAEDMAAAMVGRARLRLLGPLPPYDFVAEE